MLLRRAEPGDAMDVARVHVRSWQAGYRGLLPDAYLDGLRPEERAGRYNFASEKLRDPATMAAVTLILLVGGLTAACIPARRAAGVDPMVALRSK
jgi:hypothetical protein